MSTVLQVEDVIQEYPGVRALKGVSLSVHAGKALGLVGENGAGKSTLIRILGGIETPVSGTVRVKGENRHFKGAAESQAAGISVVSQEFRLVSQLSVADNIFLGHENTSRGVVSRSHSRGRAAALLSGLGMDLDPGRLVSSLTVGDRQMVEIARALSREFDVLIMDEPTAALNGAEIARLHMIVRRLIEQGKAVIYVSHHLDEIFEVCHDVAVLRDGNLVHQAPTSTLDETTLVEHMLGRRPQVMERDHGAPAATAAGQSRVDVDDLMVAGYEDGFSLKVAPGEILGLAGLVGSGRTELTRALFGDAPTTGGSVTVDGSRRRIRNSTQAIRAGIFMLSEDRKGEGILPHLDVTENAMISRERRGFGWRERFAPKASAESSLFERLRREMRIRVPHGRQLIGNLSGGNQQKVLLGRALLSGCKVLLLNEPTRGVDVGAKIEIYQLIKKLADDGVSVVVSSSDAPELAAVTDRCLVYFAGRQVAELRGRDITEENIVGASVGQTAGGDPRD